MKTMKFLPPAAIIFAAILWSFDGFLRQNLAGVPSFLIILLEHIIGAILFFPLLIRGWGEIKSIRERTWISVAWISIVGGILGTFFYTKALSYIGYIDLSVVVLLQKFQPLFAIALAALVLREPLTRRFLACATGALVGGYFVTFGAIPMAQWDDKTLIAALFALLAAFSWGSSTVLGKHALKNLSFLTVTSLRLWVTAIVAFIVFMSLPNQPALLSLTSQQWFIIVVIVLSTGSVALFIYYYGLKQVPATHATIYELFWPLSAVIIDWVIRGKVLSPPQMAGGVLILLSTLLLPRNRANK
ncbi:MAG: EamA family transporter [Candidatus Marinimicrobia bacterium]|nr:EamA family transporter [Candidatus Neomarinimicrobiota bacterium]MCH8068420.1 EamA family transporter [Candidatus Neomarinimicrobiota bacterium]